MTTKSDRLIVEEFGSGVGMITLNRPDKLNAFDGAMHTELLQALRSCEDWASLKVLIITGAGRGFSAGGDVSGMTGPEGSNIARGDAEVAGQGRRLTEALLAVEVPVIAMLNGPAVGLGASLVLLCDQVIAGRSARIGDRHVNVGLVAGDGGAALLPLLCGVLRAKEMLLTGRLLTADEAMAYGLVNRVVEDSELRDVTFRVAEELAILPPFALRATKAAVNKHIRLAMEHVMDLALAWEHISQEREDHRVAARKFIERARPQAQ